MYFQPYGNDQQLNLNWIINEIINLHKQLDPDYETPSFTQVYPYSNLNRLNLDWVLSELKALKELAPEPTPELDIQAVAVALVALPFDSNTSYQIYDFISRDGEIWRATEAIAAGGEWDETKWFKTKIGTDLAVLERWINAINNSLTSLQNTVGNLSSIDISDDSDAGGATVKASLNNLKTSLDTLENDLDGLTSADISDDSDAGGATVKASLNNLKGYLNAVEGDVADLETAINSLSSDDIANDSTKISGATVTAALDALRDNIKANTAWKNVSGSYGTLQAYYYESDTATTTYDLPENYVYVLCMQYKSVRGAAIAIRWQSGAYRMWINTLHDTWSGWKQITPYTSINRFTLTANCWGTWGPASTTLASYTIPETGFYDIWFCPTVNIKNDNSTRLRLYANSTLVAFGQVSSPTEIRLPLALRHMGQLTAGTVITLQCQCDVSLSDLRMLFASSETQSSDLMNHFVHRIY